jgi:hypothetical protein
MEARARTVGNDDLNDMVIPDQPETLQGRFWEWIDSDVPVTESPSSLRATLSHLESFWMHRDRPNVIMLHYDDMKADLEGEMRRLARRLGIAVPEDLWPGLVKAATFEEMKRDADNTAPGTTEQIWQDNKQFFRSGKSGGWREIFEDGDAARYEARLVGLADPGVVAWAHRGARTEARRAG